jgi:DnaJ-domain-containing protein 1
VSVFRRLGELARHNMNALLERVAERARADLNELSDHELDAELARRRAARAAAEQRLWDERYERAAIDGSRGGHRRSDEPPGSWGGERAARELHLTLLYARLECPEGADFATVKLHYRRLMRRHHPDLHAADPVRHREATQRAQALTEAYAELERLLTGGRSRADGG